MTENQHSNPCCISDVGFLAENQMKAEEQFSLTNGQILQRANFEEFYSGETKNGTYHKGIYKDKLDNSELSCLPDWISMYVRLNAEIVDLNQCDIIHFNRSLNLENGIFERNFEIITAENHHIEVSIQRFISQSQLEAGAIKYTVKSHNFNGRISFSPVIDGDINKSKSEEYEPEWNVLQSKTQQNVAHLWIQTRKTNFQICQAISYDLFKNNMQIKSNPTKIEKQKVAGFSVGVDLKANDTVCIYKFLAMYNSLKTPYLQLTSKACEMAMHMKNTGWNELIEENTSAWKQKWDKFDFDSDLELKRKNIFAEYMKIKASL